MGEVSEVLHEPRFTQLPGVKSWVKGVANLRGRLLPLMDLCGFFGEELSAQRKQRRVLVVEYNEVFVGLLVDEVLGMQHFDQARFEPVSPGTQEGPAGMFIKGRFEREQRWQVFSPFALAQSPRFMDVAL
ncbi:Chemotaxis protein CheW [compost metagenome]